MMFQGLEKGLKRWFWLVLMLLFFSETEGRKQVLKGGAQLFPNFSMRIVRKSVKYFC